MLNFLLTITQYLFQLCTTIYFMLEITNKTFAAHINSTFHLQFGLSRCMPIESHALFESTRLLYLFFKKFKELKIQFFLQSICNEHSGIKGNERGVSKLFYRARTEPLCGLGKDCLAKKSKQGKKQTVHRYGYNFLG